MRVYVDLIQVNQRWLVDRNEHRNDAELLIGNQVISVELTNDQLKALLATAAEQSAPMRAAPVEAPDPYWEKRPPIEVEEAEEQVWDMEPVEAPEPAEAPAPFRTEQIHEDGTSRVFGGDFNTDTLADAYEPDRPTIKTASQITKERHKAHRLAIDPSEARRKKQEEMRRRAAAVPRRRVDYDEAGNPRVPQANRPAPRHDAPVVQRAKVQAKVEESDDLFDQG